MMFGDDYDTKDGTCVRDYIHVSDLTSAHSLALERLMNGGESRIYNLGNGTGFTVKEVVEVARKVTGHQIPAEVAPRRAGDPAILIAFISPPKINIIEVINIHVININTAPKLPYNLE